MSSTSSTLGIARRLRFASAGMVGILGFSLLWAGFGLSDFLPLQREAVAESAPSSLYNAPLSLASKDQTALLQSTVDSAALSLSSVIASASPPLLGDRDALSFVASALSTLTFGLGGEIYFTAWEDTRMLHSPLAPDAEGMDFANAIDGRGAAFVLGMAHAAFSGGGFLQVSLPRQFSGVDRAPARGNVIVIQALDTSPIDQIVYVRRIPRSNWHIAAFMPVESRRGQGFSSVWSASADKSPDRNEADYRKGLSVSGFSLAGLAGLMLVSGHGRVRREQDAISPDQV